MEGRLYIVNVEAVVWHRTPGAQHRLEGRQPSPPTTSATRYEGAFVEAHGLEDGASRSEGRYLMVVRGATEEIAPGTLTPPGGKVEVTGDAKEVLEATLRREVLEETGVEVEDGVAYVESHTFEGGGQVILDIVFLARYRSGEPRAEDDEEIAGIEWLSFDQLMADPRTMPWTRETMRRTEEKRRSLGW